MYAADSCEHDYQEAVQEVCLSHFDGEKWSRIEAPHRLPLQSIAVTRDETIWMVTGIDATANSTSYLEAINGRCPPRPVGELRRWRSDRCWQRIRLPDSPVTLAGWTYLRFVPCEVAAQAPEDVWISGYWYFVRKPSPRRLEIKKVGGLLHLEDKIAWSDCDD